MTTEQVTDLAVAKHLRHMRLQGRSEMTIYQRGNVLGRLAAALPIPLLDATDTDLYDWRDRLASRQPATVANYVSHVKSFYDWAVAAGHVETNPAKELPVPSLPKRLPRPISEPALLTALDHASPRVRIWLVLAAWCGLRAKEIAMLKAENIRPGDSQPVIRVVHDATKGRTERVIPLAPFVVEELRRSPYSSTGLAFVKADGRPVPPALVSKLCNETLHELGIADTLHSLRHRFLTQAYQVSKDIRLTQELAGHAHIQSTAGYAKADSRAFTQTVNAIPSPLAPIEREAS